MSANITKKSDATGYLNQSINLSTDPYLTPTPIIPIKSGNLKQYLNRFIEWIFPGTPTDVRGKVLGVPHSDTANTDYSGLEWLTMMPLGGITMYAVNGINKNMGGDVFKAMINTTNPTNNNLANYTTELDGFLFCHSDTPIDVNVVGNEKYKELKKLLHGYYGNDNINNLLYLPDMNDRVPLGLNIGTSLTPPNIEPDDDDGTFNTRNYGRTGNKGGKQFHKLTTNEMPRHTHNYLKLNHKFVEENNGGGEKAANSDELNQVGPVTSPTGGDQSHENRQPYMVLSYIIKY